MLISSNPLEYGSCYYLSMVEGRNVTVSMHSAIIPTKIVLQHIISADTDENVINLFVLSPPPPPMLIISDCLLVLILGANLCSARG